MNDTWIWTIGLVVTLLLTRLPLFLNSDVLLWSDEASNQLNIKHLLMGSPFSFFYYGVRYQGITEALLSLVFVPFWGHSALSQKLVGWVVYAAFSAGTFRFLLPFIAQPLHRILAIAAYAFPSYFLFHLSFSTHGGHLLIAAMATLLFAEFFSSAQLWKWKHWLAWVGLVVIGNYTYRQFVVYIPAVLFLVAVQWRATLRIKVWIVIALIAVPILIYVFGNRYQDSLYENWSVFPSYDAVAWTPLAAVPARIYFLVFELLPNFLAAGAGTLSTIMGTVWSCLFLVLLCWRSLSCARSWRRIPSLRLECGGLILAWTVLGSIVFTPFSQWSFDGRYLIPLVPALFLVLRSQQTQKSFISKRTKVWVAGLLTLAILVQATGTVSRLYDRGLFKARNESVRAPFRGIETFLLAHGVTCCFSTYDLAYPMSLLSQERLRVSSYELPRIRAYQECALSNPRWVYIFDKEFESDPVYDSKMSTRGVGLEIWHEVGTYVIMREKHLN